MLLKFENNVSKKEYEFQVSDVGDSVLFYHFEDFILDEGMDDGQYSYTLFDDEDKIVAVGLVQIGDFLPSTTAYTKENKDVFIQYNGNN